MPPDNAVVHLEGRSAFLPRGAGVLHKIAADALAVGEAERLVDFRGGLRFLDTFHVLIGTLFTCVCKEAMA